MNETMKVLELVKTALDQLDKAMDAIDAMAEAYDLPRPGDTVSVQGLVCLVSKETKIHPSCAEKVLRTALRFARDLDLSIAVEKEDEDGE